MGNAMASVADEAAGGECRHLAGRRRILSGDILAEILLRLPIKPVFRFKSVSKEWGRIISDPSFADAYCRSRSAAPLFIVNVEGSRKIIFFNTSSGARRKLLGREGYGGPKFIQLNRSVPVEAEKLIQRFPRCYCHVSSSNGILLLATASSEYCVWNPITGESFSIPDPPTDRYNSFVVIGFVCNAGDSSSPKLSYKVVVVSNNVNHNADPIELQIPNSVNSIKIAIPSDTLRIETFSSDTGRWAVSILKMRPPMPICFLPQSETGVVASNGIMYWLTHTCEWEGNNHLGCAMAAHDPTSNGLELMALPPGCGHDRRYWSSCSLHRGFDGALTLCNKSGSEILIWVLGRTWYLQHKLSFDFLTDLYFEILYLCEEDRQEVIYVMVGNSIFRCYVDRARNPEVCCAGGVPDKATIVPLVLPQWPLSLPKSNGAKFQVLSFLRNRW